MPNLYQATLCWRPLLIITFTCVSVSGCSSEQGSRTSQAAAKVNSQEITIHQVNGQLANVENVSDENFEVVSRNVLEGLIDQELLVQRARELDLDRTPHVVLAIEAAKRNLIAQAYVQSLTTQISQVDSAEIEAFYINNPALFEERRLYTLRELKIALSSPRIDEVELVAISAQSIDEVVRWLDKEEILFTSTSGIKAAEEFPLELLSRFATLQEGDMCVLNVEAGLVVLELISTVQQPLSKQRARPVIERILTKQKAAKLVDAEIHRLRSVSDISYVGQFSGADSVSHTGITQSPNAPRIPQNRSMGQKEPAVAEEVSDQE